MVFVETDIFTQVIRFLISDEEYSDLQLMLIRDPKAGDLIPGGRGLRKVRWASQERQKGKRGGIRVIYYIRSANFLYMIFAYGKHRQDDLTSKQLKVLTEYVRRGVI